MTENNPGGLNDPAEDKRVPNSTELEGAAADEQGIPDDTPTEADAKTTTEIKVTEEPA